MSGVIVMLSGRTKTVHGVSYEFARSANVVHRSLEPFHHSVHSQCSPWRNSGEFWQSVVTLPASENCCRGRGSPMWVPGL